MTFKKDRQVISRFIYSIALMYFIYIIYALFYIYLKAMVIYDTIINILIMLRYKGFYETKHSNRASFSKL